MKSYEELKKTRICIKQYKKNDGGWEQMNKIKEIFFNDDEVVIQIHPAKKDYINKHPYVLHLWRPQNVEIPLPDKLMV